MRKETFETSAPGVQSAGSLFDVLGREALHGRTFRAEDGLGAERVRQE
jgi:hypothetical protein